MSRDRVMTCHAINCSEASRHCRWSPAFGFMLELCAEHFSITPESKRDLLIDVGRARADHAFFHDIDRRLGMSMHAIEAANHWEDHHGRS